MDLMTKYFLRRFAKARRDPKADQRKAFDDAVFETSLVFILFPAFALINIALLAGLRFWPKTVTNTWMMAPKVAAICTGILIGVIGHRGVGRHFRALRMDTAPWWEFDSAADRRLVAWQTFGVFCICAIVVPFLAYGFSWSFWRSDPRGS